MLKDVLTVKDYNTASKYENCSEIAVPDAPFQKYLTANGPTHLSGNFFQWFHCYLSLSTVFLPAGRTAESCPFREAGFGTVNIDIINHSAKKVKKKITELPINLLYV